MSHPGSNGGNLHSCTNNGVVNSGQQDPGLYSSCLHPGPSSHPRHVPARPIFYVHAPTPQPPPPPPFLHYQWPLPMPLFYNPLEGFPGMGYGLVMPPFPPYMDAPAYIMPHPHIQPVDYRRLVNPQVHAPTALYPNPNQTRRPRPPHSVPIETVNTEVQTEPTQGGGDNYGDRSPLVRSDSGHGTAPVSPSSSSSSQKQHSAEVDNFENLSQQVRTLAISNVGDIQVNDTNTKDTDKHGLNILRPTETKGVQSIRATLEEQTSHKDNVVKENVPPCQYSRCNVWSVSSSDSIVPVCSSSQRERHASFSDVQMSWKSGTPQATVLKMVDKMLPQNEQLLPSVSQTELEKSADQSSADAEVLLGSKDRECLFKILKLPLAQSRREDNVSIPHQMSSNSCHIRKKLNESVWSVESLPPFIPTKEWLIQNGMFEPEVIVEMVEEAENCSLSTQNDDLTVNATKECDETPRISLCESVGMKSHCSPEKEATLLNSPGAEETSPTSLLIVQNGADMETEDGIYEQLCVPMADLKMADVSPSKGHLVDCGIQCNKLQEVTCLCEEMKSSMGPNRRNPFRFSDMKANNGSTEGFYMTGHMQKNQKRFGQWRNRGSERSGSQQEPYSGHSGKPGKRGGKNHR